MKKLLFILLCATALGLSCKGSAKKDEPVRNDARATFEGLLVEKLEESKAYTSDQVKFLVRLEFLLEDWKAAYDYSEQGIRAIEDSLRTDVQANKAFLMAVAAGDELTGKKIASGVLGFGGSSDFLPVLLNNLMHPSPAVKANSAVSIGLIGDKGTQTALLVELMLFSSDADVRNNCAFAVYKTTGPSADQTVYDALIKALGDPDEGVRNQSVRALIKIDRPMAAEVLASKTIGDSVPTVVDNVILALQTLEAYEVVIGTLIKNLSSENHALKTNSYRALKLVTDTDLGAEGVAWDKWWTNNKDSFLKAKEAK